MSIGENAIKAPPAPELMLTALDVQKGEPVHPLDRLMIMSADEWEIFTLELVFYFDKHYEQVTRCAGAGDKGRDVIARFSSGWDNYQCKHYGRKLNVADVVAELGKLVFYTWRGDYTLPQDYRFVTPKGCSSDCIDMLVNKSRIKTEIIARWDVECRDKITKTESILLEGDFLDYLNSIDFSFVDEMSSLELVDKHQQTPYHSSRFGSYHLKRPQLKKDVPVSVGDNEKIYIEALLHAFSDVDGKEYSHADALTSDYAEDLERARINFFSAESLEVFSRDAFPEGCYRELKEDCYEGLHSLVRQEHRNGYERFLKVSTQAVNVPYDSHPLVHYIRPSDRKGLCHQLVNDRKIKWVRR